VYSFNAGRVLLCWHSPKTNLFINLQVISKHSTEHSRSRRTRRQTEVSLNIMNYKTESTAIETGGRDAAAEEELAGNRVSTVGGDHPEYSTVSHVVNDRIFRTVCLFVSFTTLVYKFGVV
jgi:hypothetical protein